MIVEKFNNVEDKFLDRKKNIDAVYLNFHQENDPSNACASALLGRPYESIKSAIIILEMSNGKTYYWVVNDYKFTHCDGELKFYIKDVDTIPKKNPAVGKFTDYKEGCTSYFSIEKEEDQFFLKSESIEKEDIAKIYGWLSVSGMTLTFDIQNGLYSCNIEMVSGDTLSLVYRCYNSLANSEEYFNEEQ